MRKSSVLDDDERIELEVLGRRLREIREKQGITVAELAKLAGVDRDNYSRVEKGEKCFTRDYIYNSRKIGNTAF